MKAAFYVRVSTVEQAQEGYSIPAQIALLKEYAKMNNYEVYKIYQDAGISGKNIKDRPALNELIKDAKNKKFDIAAIWKLSRLSRSLLDLLSIVDIFNKHDVALHSYSEKFDTSTPIGKMLLQMLGSIAEFERNTIAENVRMGLNERFKRGYSKSAVPFGYIHEDKKAVINPEQAEIVKHVFYTYRNSPDGNCLTELAEEMNNKGFRTRTGGLWSRNAVKDMLINHFYAGYVRTGIHSHGKRYKNADIIKGEHEAIIPEDVFNAVNEKLAAKKREKVIRNPDNESILTGLVVCPICGAKMFALNTYNKHVNKDGTVKKSPIRMYRCNEKDKGKGVCKGIYVSANKIEKPFMEILKKSITDGDISEIKEMANPDISNNTNNIDRELRRYFSLKERYFSLFETGKVDPLKFADKINEILDKIDALEKERDAFLVETNIDPSEIVDNIKSFIELYNTLSNSEKKAFVRSFVKEVIITKEKKVDYILLKSRLKCYYH